MKYVLLLILAALQICDVITTNVALAMPGISEANPVWAFAQTSLGGLWFVPKLAVAGLAILAIGHYPTTRPVWTAVSIYFVIVSVNVLTLAGLT